MLVKVEKHLLSDRSEVFDVSIAKDGVRIVAHAVSEKDASDLCFKIVEALRDHSVESVREF